LKAHKYDNYNPVLFGLIPAGQRVLDVGCGGGALMAQLQTQKGAKIRGLEYDPALVKICRARGLKVTRADLESPQALPVKGPFDQVVCGDVLEHLRDPGRVLRSLRPLLAPGGRLWVSLPNVAFATVRLKLLLGRFDYNPQGGIMDSEHLRFFTRRSGAQLIEAAGYRVRQVHPCNVVRARYAFMRPLGRLWPSLLSYQFVFEAEALRPQ
jgi:methionine biosynthesis protein MetW